MCRPRVKRPCFPLEASHVLCHWYRIADEFHAILRVVDLHEAYKAEATDCLSATAGGVPVSSCHATPFGAVDNFRPTFNTLKNCHGQPLPATPQVDNKE
jgi:hypothetical protein